MHAQATREAEKADLLAHKAQVQAELQHLQAGMEEALDSDPDEGDGEIFEHAKNAALSGVLGRRLAEINAALRALDDGVYGTCARCGERIEAQRMQAKPDATLCLDCQRGVEASGRGNRVSPRSGARRAADVPAVWDASRCAGRASTA